MQQYCVSMTRYTNKGTRYYKLMLYLNLFDEFVVERQYGRISYKTPTGTKKDFFNSFDDAVIIFKKLLKQKKKKGYKDEKCRYYGRKSI